MSDSAEDIVIVAARRTALGSLSGQLSSLAAPALGAASIRAIMLDTGIQGADIDEVFMGCVLAAGLGQAPARQATLLAGLPVSVASTTINKVCGSAMKTMMIAHDLIKAGSVNTVIAGGMESMSNAPYLLPKVRQGLRMGHQQVLDHMFLDGLENAADKQLMGCFAEACADKYRFSRLQQDAYAIESLHRALNAIEDGAFKNEITAVSIKTKGHEQTVAQDEQPFKAKEDKIPTLKPAFRREGGTVTAANSSSISDGAAAMMLMSSAEAKRRKLTPMARIIAHSGHAQAPEDFTTAPVTAIKKLMEKTAWNLDSVDLWEINEAFAVVAMAAIQELNLDPAKVNVNGGACALGHPIGATGARIVVTLIHSLQQRGLSKGIASLCIGGGEATAIAIEC